MVLVQALPNIRWQHSVFGTSCVPALLPSHMGFWYRLQEVVITHITNTWTIVKPNLETYSCPSACMICKCLLWFQLAVQDGIPHPMVIAVQALMKGECWAPETNWDFLQNKIFYRLHKLVWNLHLFNCFVICSEGPAGRHRCWWAEGSAQIKTRLSPPTQQKTG